MDAFRPLVSSYAGEVLSALPARIEAIQNLGLSSDRLKAGFGEVEEAFMAANRAELERLGGAGLDSAKGEGLRAPGAGMNEEVARLISQTQEALLQGMADLESLKRWIVVNIPRIEDGGNFGVIVQESVHKSLSDAVKELREKHDGLSEYHSKRLDALKAASAVELSFSESTSEGTAVKEGKSEPTGSSESKASRTVKVAVPQDAVANLTKVDLKYFFAAKFALQSTADALLMAGFAAKRNAEKLENPRGTSSRGLNMY